MKNILIPIVALSMLSACGNSDKVDNKKAPPQQVNPNNRPPMPPNPNEGGGGGPANPGGGPQGPRGPNDRGGRNERSERPKQPSVDNRPSSPEPSLPQQQPVDNSSEQNQPLNRGSYGSRFTGAADDGYRAFLKAKLDAVENPEANLLNQDTAENVASVRSFIEGSEVSVGITFKDSDKEIRLAGSLEGSKAKLSLVNGQDSSVAIVGTLTCLDEDQSACSANHIRLKVGQSPQAAYLHILIRKTTARLRASLPDSKKGNPGFEKLLQLLKDTGKKVLIDSFEVINGRSAVSFSITGSNKEVIFGKALLLKALDDRNTTKIAIIRNMDPESLPFSLDENAKLGIQKSISDMRLVSNDGKSTIGVQITIGDRSLPIGLVRVAPALRSPGDAVTSEAL